jgi:hypothetical protein
MELNAVGFICFNQDSTKKALSYLNWCQKKLILSKAEVKQVT